MNLLLTLLKPIFDVTVKFLKKYQRQTGILPLQYFYSASGLMPLSAVELLILRRVGSDVEVLLTQREATDPYWPNKWHHAGTILRNGDTFEKVWTRLAREVRIERFETEPKLVDFFITNNARSWNTHAMYVLWVDETVKFGSGQFFSLQNLPENTIDFQKSYLIQKLDFLV